MTIIKMAKNKITFWGINLFNIKRRKEIKLYYLLGILVFRKRTIYGKIRQSLRTLNSFNVNQYDAQIAFLAQQYKVGKKNTVHSQRIAFLATALYNMGGHSKWLRDMQRTLSLKYKEKLFVIDGEATRQNGQEILSDIKNFSELEMFDVSKKKNAEIFNYESELIKKVYDAITEFAPRALFVFIHSDDVIGATVLAMIKQHTKIRIFYVNHATHRPNLGMSFADLILEETPSTAYITQKLRGLQQTHIVGLISKREEDNPVYTQNDILTMRDKIGLPRGCFCTMSGASSYKFFSDNDSVYFKMIKKLLEHNPTLYHVVITVLNKTQKKILNKIFKNSEVFNRLIIIPYQKDYELVFKCADLFIDSIPMSSALTFIDLMRLKVPYVVKINIKDASLSFHEYQMPDYPYMYTSVEDMIAGIDSLIRDFNKRTFFVEKNYDFYLSKYEPKAAFKILDTILSAPDVSSLYDDLAPGLNYSFGHKIFK